MTSADESTWVWGSDDDSSAEVHAVHPIKSMKSESKALDQSANNAVTRFYLGAGISLSLVVAYFMFVFPPLDSVPGDECQPIIQNGFFSTIKSVLSKSEDENQEVKPLLALYQCATAYERSSPYVFKFGYFLAYVVMQAFAIPGTGILTQLAGALYPFTFATGLVSFCATTGAAASYLVSQNIGGSLIKGLGLEAKVDKFRIQLNSALGSSFDLFKFMAISRVTPIPNVVINVASPHLGVPFFIFTGGTWLGLFPLNSLHITSGATIATLGDQASSGSTKLLILLGGSLVGAIALYFGVIKKKTDLSKDR